MATTEEDSGAYDFHNQRRAAVVKWRDCIFPFDRNPNPTQQPFVLNNQWIPTPTGNGWYVLRPVNNLPGWDDPCLNFNTTNSGNTLIQFKCQYNVDNELWAPIERDYVAPPPTQPPTPPTGAHLLDEGVPTPLERKSDLACMSRNTDETFKIDSARLACDEFVPELTAGGYSVGKIASAWGPSPFGTRWVLARRFMVR